MSPDVYARVRVLMAQGRYDAAIKELLTILPSRPTDVDGLVLLVFCQSNLGKLAEGLATAQQVVELAPGRDDGYYARSIVEYKQSDYTAAERSVRTAISINPVWADHHGHLAAILFRQQRWAETVVAADAGLAQDPDSELCLNNRAIALTKLGRHAEADATLTTLLSLNPQYGLGHANLGWSLLHSHQPRVAEMHFRESLRINPASEWAKEGFVESVRARSWFYRRVLAFKLWRSRLTRRTKVKGTVLLVLLAVLVFAIPSGNGVQIVSSVIFLGLLGGGLLALLFVGIASPFADLRVMRHPEARGLLTREQKSLVILMVPAWTLILICCGTTVGMALVQAVQNWLQRVW